MSRSDIESVAPTRARLIRVSGNRKTGPIPVSYSSARTCPDACPLKENGCYAELSKVRMHWRDDERFDSWPDFLAQVRALPRGQLWRHNVAGDLPGIGDRLDLQRFEQLVRANKGRRGWTYTHKPVRTTGTLRRIRWANESGFTVNLSADTLREADQLAALDIGPVCVTLPSDAPQVSKTPAGRTVVACPAESRDISCADCQLCQNATRKAIVGFRAHGAMAKRVSLRVIQ